MSLSNIPVYIIIQKRTGSDDDDVESVISFNTARSSCDSDYIWEDTRWALEASAPPRRHSHHPHWYATRSSTGRPHHPERSISYNSSNKALSADEQQPQPQQQVLLTNSSGHSGTHSNNNNSENQSPLAAETTRRTKKLPPTARGMLNRTTRLSRMAERAKAVARTQTQKTPVVRRKSFRNNLCHRHSLPPHLPRRNSSAKHNHNHNHNKSYCEHSMCLDCSCSSSGNHNTTTSECSSSLTNSLVHAGGDEKYRRLGAPITKSMTAIQQLQRQQQRRNTIALVPCPSRSRSGGLDTFFRQHPAFAVAAAPTRRASTTGVFRVACAAAAAATMNRPPRLPQRYPSEVLSNAPEQQ